MCPALSRRVFLLSPAHAGGVRAGHLLNPAAAFPRAVQLRDGELSLADAFTFMSGLYFRGKIAYARHFARGDDLIRVITTNSGLWDPDALVDARQLRKFGTNRIDVTDPGYHGPLRRDARRLARELGPGGTAILLGSIATPKYRGTLAEVFGSRLIFPVDFIGRGDMSRGSLLLQAVRRGTELPYEPVQTDLLVRRRELAAP